MRERKKAKQPGLTVKNAMQLLMGIHLKELGLEDFRLEHEFHPDRKWKFDLALLESRVAIEIHGSVWTQGRHTRGAGFLADREKMNTAQMMGWRVLEFSTQQVEDLTAKSFISSWLGRAEG